MARRVFQHLFKLCLKKGEVKDTEVPQLRVQTPAASSVLSTPSSVPGHSRSKVSLSLFINRINTLFSIQGGIADAQLRVEDPRGLSPPQPDFNPSCCFSVLCFILSSFKHPTWQRLPLANSEFSVETCYQIYTQNPRSLLLKSRKTRCFMSLTDEWEEQLCKVLPWREKEAAWTLPECHWWLSWKGFMIPRSLLTLQTHSILSGDYAMSPASCPQ